MTPLLKKKSAFSAWSQLTSSRLFERQMFLFSWCK